MQNFDINKLRVASPCSVGWETMTGNERVRLCHSCQMNIYNISEMTKPEVENLIANREGRLCIRLYKRADGTVLTKDCPVGLRAYQKRVARFAGATFAAILGLFSFSFGQKEEKNILDASKAEVIEAASQKEKGSLTIKVKDSAGAAIPNVELIIRQNDGDVILSARSDANGEYTFSSLSEGAYIIETKSKNFADARYENVQIIKGKTTFLEMLVEPKGKTVVVGIFAETPLVDVTESGVTTTITRRMMDILPR
jgi:hypothetical protein